MRYGDDFDFLLQEQRKLTSMWGRIPDGDDPAAMSAYVRDCILCLTDEAHELLHECYWRPWQKQGGIRDLSAFREELADILHFLLELYLVTGCDGPQIIEDYMTKHQENIRRVSDMEYINGSH